jgi:hypothetical protein
MARKVLLLILALAGCSKGAEADLPAIGEARSLAAEWALVNDQAAQGKLTDVYVAAMRSSLKQQADSAASAVTAPDSAYAREMRAIAAEPLDAPPDRLRARSDRLKRIEDQLESA